MRVFHIYSDGKTVKEISFEAYKKMSDTQRKGRTFLYVWDTEIAVFSHDHFTFIGKRRQIEQVLKECWR